MFEILMYLFENYMNSNVRVVIDHDSLMTRLEQLGFHMNDIDRALDWLHGLILAQEAVSTEGFVAPIGALRHYHSREAERIPLQVRGFILYLEQIGILDAKTREVVIDRLLALESHEVDIPRVKWVALFALFNQPDKKTALSLLQDMVLTDAFDTLH